MRVLHVDHAGVLGGAQHSLLELLSALTPDVSVGLACPPGPLASEATNIGVQHLPISGMAASLRLDRRHTPGALADARRSAATVRAGARRLGADVVHANSPRAGLIAALAGLAGGPPHVVHVRDVLPGGAVAAATRLVLRVRADQRVAITAHVAHALRLPAVLVENPIDLARLDPGRVDAARAREGLRTSGRPAVAHVAQLTEWKGQLDLVEAWPQVLARVPDAALLLVGEMKFSHPGSRWDNADYVERLTQRIAQLRLTDSVHLLGERRDIPEILTAVDLLALPSWDEPFGRAAAEAMAMARPVVATSVGGPAEFVVDGKTGLLLAPRRPSMWAEAIADLLLDPGRRDRMGSAGRTVARERFSRERHAAAMLEVFETAAAGRAGRL